MNTRNKYVITCKGFRTTCSCPAMFTTLKIRKMEKHVKMHLSRGDLIVTERDDSLPKWLEEYL